MPRLPSAQDVPKVSPRVSSDPGVTAPAQAFQSALGVAAEEFSPGVEKYSQVIRQQENRRDTIDRSDKINQYNREVEEELRRINAENDLSREDVMAEYGSYLSKRRQELLESHGGSQDSKTILTLRLQDVEAAAIGRAAGISAKVGLDKVRVRHQDILTPLATRAAQNPRLDNIDRVLTDFETQFDDISGALDPTEEEALRQAGREHIAMSAIEPLIVRGKVETAESLLMEGGLAQYISPESQRSLRRSIETIRFNRDEKTKELSEREKRIIQLRERGFSEEFAQDVAAKDVSVVGPDKFGEFYVVNTVTGTRRKVEGSDRGVIDGIVSPVETPETTGTTEPATEMPPKRGLEEDVMKGTGPFSKLQAGISNVFGPVIEGAVFKDTTDARQQVRIFSQIAKTGLVNNDRFPVKEQEIVQNLLPDPDKFFLDPDTAASNLRELKGFLTTSKAAKLKESKKEKISSERRADLADQVSKIDELLSLMEKPKSKTGKATEKTKRPTVNSQEQVDALEKGTKFIWEPTGDLLEKE